MYRVLVAYFTSANRGSDSGGGDQYYEEARSDITKAGYESEVDSRGERGFRTRASIPLMSLLRSDSGHQIVRFYPAMEQSFKPFSQVQDIHFMPYRTAVSAYYNRLLYDRIAVPTHYC